MYRTSLFGSPRANALNKRAPPESRIRISLFGSPRANALNKTCSQESRIGPPYREFKGYRPKPKRAPQESRIRTSLFRNTLRSGWAHACCRRETSSSGRSLGKIRESLPPRAAPSARSKMVSSMKRRCSVPLHPLCAAMATFRLQADFSETRARPKTGFAGTTRRQLHGGGPAPTHEELKQRERRGRFRAHGPQSWPRTARGHNFWVCQLNAQGQVNYLKFSRA